MLPALALSLTACRPGGDDVGIALPDVTGPAGTLFLAELRASSGAGVERVLDGASTTSWRPAGDPSEETVDLRFESPVAADALTIEACERSDVRVYLNGRAGALVRLQAGRVATVDLVDPHARELVWLRIGVEGGAGCLAEIGLREGADALPLRPPRSVRGHARASASREPASLHGDAWLTDGSLDRGWRADGPQRLLVTFDEPVELTGLEARGAAVVSLEDGGALVPLGGGPRASIPPQAREALTLVVDDAAAGVDELRLFDAHGPLVLATSAPPVVAVAPGSALDGALDRTWQSVCGHPGRRYRLRGDGALTVRVLADGDGPKSDVIEGAWGVVGEDGPWTRVEVRARRWDAGGRWQVDAATDAVQGTFEVATVAALGEPGVAAVLRDLGAARADRTDCLAFELGAWDDAWPALVAGGALVVRGTGAGESPFQDLVWHP